MAQLVLFHRTTIGEARAIAKRGFEDDKWSFDLLDSRSGQQVKLVGVWLTDRPLSEDEGPRGDAVLEVKLGLSEESIVAFEVNGIFRDARLWVVPAELINPLANVRILAVDPRTSWWYETEGEEG